jgi:hypothetical protein
VRLAWVTLALSLGLVVFSRALMWLPTYPTDDEPASLEFVSVVAVIVLVSVGALITIRRHKNMIGWIFCASGLLWALGGAADTYALRLSGAPQPLRDPGCNSA